MSRRLRLVWRYTLVSVVVMLGITAVAVWARLRHQESPAQLEHVEGITDDLGRTIPPDFPRVRFVDATADSGVDFDHDFGRRGSMLPEDMGSGAAWGDYDGDGDEDLYLVGFGSALSGAPETHALARANALYRNDGGGSFRDVATEAGVAARGHFMGAFFGDYDNDGDLDLYLTAYGANVLYHNDGSGRFSDVTEAAGVGDARWSTGAAWGDYDRDGDLDLYVCNYVAFQPDPANAGASVSQYGYSVPSSLNPSSFEPVANALYRNDGNGGFTDVATELGVDDATGRSLVAAFVDFDDDGIPDLYVADDVSKNALYHGLPGGRFEDLSAPSLAADYRGAMGIGLGDFDSDGDTDMFITHWIAQENALYQNTLLGDPKTGKLMFFDIADQVGVGAPGLDRVSWGTAFFDYDNDRRPDLFVVNGHTFEDKADRARLVAQPPQLFWNRHPEGFFDVTNVSGAALQRPLVGRGAAFADYDQDGDVDVLVTTNGGRAVLLENEGGNVQQSLTIELVGVRSNRAGIGAQVLVSAGGVTRRMERGAEGSYLSQNSHRLGFGLGTAAIAERVEVRWPSAEVDVYTGLAAGHIHRLTEGGEVVSRSYR